MGEWNTIIHSFKVGWSSTLHYLHQLFSLEFWMYLLTHYKYSIVILGALIEGEMILMLAGGAAYHGYLSLYFVIATAFIGAVIHDHLLFFLGRICGQKILDASPRWHKRLSKVSALITKYDQYFIMGFRFVYGLRTLTPLIVGQSPMRLRRYSLLVSISALLWAIVVSLLGYTGAFALNKAVTDFDRYKKYLALLLLGIAFVIGMGIRFFKKIRKKKRQSPR